MTSELSSVVVLNDASPPSLSSALLSAHLACGKQATCCTEVLAEKIVKRPVTHVTEGPIRAAERASTMGRINKKNYVNRNDGRGKKNQKTYSLQERAET